MSRAATVTKAQLRRALAAASDAWGTEARVIVNPDRSIVIERRQGPASEATAPAAAKKVWRL